ncbi:23S rRNA (cytidine1920-2'-O)/16S rRNA (cytidine1409-2'-O)-methyltransferase [Microbacteriaceae bacterium MWH-Ta3]|nr:23S rRNA (cytidine1920-2'-O)/16S rRNA (cytidine1409-2'-O)-methyltransferase [Microbacteriaceae bacterium MWH-Ta3]
MTPPADERLDVALVSRGLVESRTRAARLIEAGHVSVDGDVVTKHSTRVTEEAVIAVRDTERWVSRAAVKLVAAIEEWKLNFRDAVVLDVGASTGGFTEVVLSEGARHVVALDVGHNQLHDRIRQDPRVTVVEGENARYLTALRLRECAPDAPPITWVVSDVSFISLTLLIPALVDTVGNAVNYVFLIKPQFEVGRTGVSDGIARSAIQRRDAVRRVVNAAAAAGLTISGIQLSPVTGEHGNIEVLLWCGGGQALDTQEWNNRIDAL